MAPNPEAEGRRRLTADIGVKVKNTSQYLAGWPQRSFLLIPSAVCGEEIELL